MKHARLILVAGVLWLAADAGASAEQVDSRAIFRAAAPAVVAIYATDAEGKRRRGTGFFVSPALLVTSAHIVAEARDVRVVTASGTSNVARLVADPAADIALIQVVEPSWDFLPVSPAARAEVGERVFVISNPAGYTRSLTHGLVSGLRRRDGEDLLQISAAVAPGSSGGPILDSQGRVIGVVMARLAAEASIAFGVPIRRAMPLAVPFPADVRPRGFAPAPAPAPQAGRLPAMAGPDDGEPGHRAWRTVRIGLPNWDSARIKAHLLRLTLERVFPVNVVVREGSNEDIFRSLRASDGRYDVHPEVWLPNHRRFLSEDVHLAPKAYDTVQSICVPRYVSNRMAISKLDDMLSRGISRFFDTNGDGRGEIWIGAEGWESTRISRLLARDHGVAAAYDLETGDEGAFYDRLGGLVRDKRPVAFFCYGPHWVFRKYDLTRLALRPYDPSCFKLADGEAGEAWLRKSRAACGPPPSSVRHGYSRELRQRAPEIAAFIDGFTLDYEEMSELVYRYREIGSTPERVAETWVRENAQSLKRLYRFD